MSIRQTSVRFNYWFYEAKYTSKKGNSKGLGARQLVKNIRRKMASKDQITQKNLEKNMMIWWRNANYLNYDYMIF